ncbi:MAG TPA: hypothetical protein VNJ12_02120 [Candidatus Dormibacteraeota bacterium]|nr:hypothetical protein [Candidatus Dormibacteraeota bacterium]
MGFRSLGTWVGGSYLGKGKPSGQLVRVLRMIGEIAFFSVLGLGAGCGGGGSASSSGITIAVTPGTASLSLSGVQQFTATVSNDSTDRGVTWSLTQLGNVCAPSCGTIFPVITPSGTPTTYVAPPALLGAGGAGVTLTATAVANTNAKATAAIVVGGTISVQVSPATATVALSGTQIFNASALNDTSTNGISWGLMQNGTACAPGCGTISPTTTISCGTFTPPTGGFCTANSGYVTYTAPSTAPTSDTVQLTVTDITAPGETGWAVITIQGAVSVSISPGYANVPVKGMQTFTATIANQTGNTGVNWALSQNGSSCSASACGTISSTSSTSGGPITYTAPAAPTNVTLTATSAADPTQSAYATIVVQPISVTVSPTTAILYATGTTQFTATVSNDPAQKGVTWSLTENGSACTSACGTISPTSTAGGVATTFTAPSTISTATTVTVTATSVSDTTKSASAIVSLFPPATVTVSPTSATIAVGSRGSFTPTVVNDPTNAGVTWSLTQGGKGCSPTCGTVSPTTTASGVATVYIAPTTMPSSSAVTLVATSNADLSQTASAAITLAPAPPVAKLSGSYTLLSSGYNSSGSVVMVGSFTADGTGNVTGGLADVNQAAGLTSSVPLAGSYTIGTDNVGSLTLTNRSNGAALGTFHFALNSSGDQVSFIETGASGMAGWGTIHKQKAAPSAAALNGDYAFSTSGTDPQGGRFALAGTFHADGAGRITSGVLDSNDGGSVASEVPFTGSYSVSSKGRGVLTADTPSGAMHWAFYMVSPGELILASTDPSSAVPVSAGEASAQAPGQSSAFSAASLDGPSVISLAGTASDGVGSDVAAGLVTFDGSGGLKYTIDRNDGGTIGSLSGNGTYSVEPDGRVTMWLPSVPAPLVSYLSSPGQGVVVGTGTGASTGLLEAQAPGPFSDASLSGGYVWGTWAAPSSAALPKSGVVTSAGRGRLAETAYSAAPLIAPSQQPESFQDAYTVAPNGRAVTGGGGSVLYLISSSKAVMVNLAPGDSAGTISRIEK